ncbi:MAG: HAD hydrolase family protein [Desulfobacteraceae bacterium]
MKHRLEKIELLLLDVDGVLTTGEIIYADSGEQIKVFHARDGLGLRLLMDNHIQAGIVTGRTACSALTHRCRNLGIDLVCDGIKDKNAALGSIADTTGISLEHTAFMGDDLIDLPAMKIAGISITVPDAPEEVKKRADIITKARGGQGAVREACEMILKAKNLWEKALRPYIS